MDKPVATPVVDDFASGYVGAEVPVSEETTPDPGAEGLTAAIDEIATPADGTGQAGATPAAAPAANAEETPTGKVEISTEEYARLMAMPSTIEKMQEEFNRKLDSAFGKIGSTEQLVRKIQEATPRGEVPKLTKEDLGKFGENYEYMSDDLLDTFNTILAKVHNAGGPSTDIPSLVQQSLQEVLPNVRKEIREEVSRDFEKRAVLQKHPDADKLFGTPELLEFVGSLPEAERNVVANSWRAEDVVPFLDKFKAAKAAKEKPAPSNVTSIDRKAALKAAVNPSSAAGAPRAKTEDDEFLAGYNSGRT